MKIKVLPILIILLTTLTFAQNMQTLTVAFGRSSEEVPYFNRKGVAYVSSRQLANALSGNYYYSKETAKTELKFNNYKLKVTAKNQFIILINRNDNSYKIYQIPISTLLIGNDVFIPLEYTLEYVALAFGKEIDYDPASKVISVSGTGKTTIVKRDRSKDKVDKSTSKKRITSKYDVYDIAIEEKSNGTLIRLKASKPLHKYSSAIQNGKLFVFLSGATVIPGLTSKIKTAGLVRKVNTRYVQGNYQLEFDLRQGYSSAESFNDVGTDDILISVHGKALVHIPDTTEVNGDKEKWDFDVVVIDPGHGGKDSGAIGVSGTREKDINLKIGLKLGELIEKEMPELNVVYTRKTDNFVELYRRGKIANENGGKLFISIHCNSLRQKPSRTRGFEVYLLRPGRTQEAIDIAEFENSVIKYEDNPDRYKELTEENFILVSMAHSSYMRHSEKLSDIINQNWTQCTSIPTRGVKQAGFYVLVGASMPSVLIESGFLSNRLDEAYLNSSKGQSDIAKCLLEAVKKYKEYYKQVLEGEV